MKNFKNLKTGLVICTALVLVMVSCKKNKNQENGDNKPPAIVKPEITALGNMMRNAVSNLGVFPEYSRVIIPDAISLDLPIIAINDYDNRDCDKNYIPYYDEKIQFSTDTKNGVYDPYFLYSLTFSSLHNNDSVYLSSLAQSKLIISEVNKENTVLNIVKEIAFNNKSVEGKSIKNPLYDFDNDSTFQEAVPFFRFDLNGDSLNEKQIYVSSYKSTCNYRENSYDYSTDSSNLAQNLSLNFLDFWPRKVLSTINIYFNHEFEFQKNKRYKFEFFYVRKDQAMVSQHLFYGLKEYGYYCIKKNDPFTEEASKMFDNKNSDYWKGSIDKNPLWEKYFIKVKN